MITFNNTEIQKAGEQIAQLCAEADGTLAYVQSLTAEDVKAELGALMLRLTHLKTSFEKVSEKLQKQAEEAGEDTPEGKMALQFRTMAANELRWIEEMLETLKDSRKSLHLSESMRQQAFAARLKSRLV